jgi:hypothetical protein
MSKLIVSFLSIFFISAPLMVASQDDGAVEEVEVTTPATSEFTESIEINDGVLHYQGESTVPGSLVESWHDTDGDGEIDTWFRYESDVVVEESYDTTGDGEPDVVLLLDAEERVSEITGPEAPSFIRPSTARFEPEPISLTQSSDEDLVGDLSDITIKEPTNNWIFFVLLFLVGAMVYLFWQRQK